RHPIVFSFDILHAPIRTVLICATRIDTKRADVEGVNPCCRKQFLLAVFESFESSDSATIWRAVDSCSVLDRHFNATSTIIGARHQSYFDIARIMFETAMPSTGRARDVGVQPRSFGLE